MSVDLVTYCCSKDIYRIYVGFNALVDSHKYPFQGIVASVEEGLTYEKR